MALAAGEAEWHPHRRSHRCWIPKPLAIEIQAVPIGTQHRRGNAGVSDGSQRSTEESGAPQQSGELPLLFLSGVSSNRAAWLAGFPPPTVSHVSMALQCVQETILSAETVPRLTNASHTPLDLACINVIRSRIARSPASAIWVTVPMRESKGEVGSLF